MRSTSTAVDMAECKAYGCTNSKRKKQGKHFFRVPIPYNPERRSIAKQWLHNLGTGHTLKTFPFGSNSVVCEDHFEQRCFAEDSVNKTLGLPQRKRLHRDAVPTIFVHRKPKLDSARSRRFDERQKSKREAESLQVSKQAYTEYCGVPQSLAGTVYLLWVGAVG